MSGVSCDIIPETWYRAAVPVPAGEEAEAFIHRLTEDLAGNWLGAWAWTATKSSLGDAVILATPEASRLTALLAHALSVSQSTPKPEAWLQASRMVFGIMQKPGRGRADTELVPAAE